jgi:lipopolysaccharide transport system permease protein
MSSDVTSEQLAEFDSRERRITVIGAPAISLSGVLRDVAKLSHYRDLLYTLSVHRVKVRYKQSVLGVAWAVLQPLSLMLIYTLIFSYIARMPSDGIPYAVFAYSALLPWTYFSTALVNSTNGLVSHADLVTKVYFPREILPLTYVIAALFDFMVASTVFAGLLIYYNVQVTWMALYSLPIILVLTCFTTAVSLLFSATQVRFRDIGVAMPLLMQLWMFASPVVYPLSAVPAWLRPFYMLNPMAGIIESFRRVMLQGEPPDFTSLGVALVGSLVLLAISYVYFKRVEATIADVI